MAIKPILFNTDMVRAILEGKKTQTRRLVKPHYHVGDAGFNVVTMANTGAFCYIEYYDADERSTERRMNPPYNRDDILWVRETWKQYTAGTFGPGLIDGYMYKADEPKDTSRMMVEGRWHPSIHMPRKAARIFLRVTDVRAENLQSITEEDAMDEGVKPEPPFSMFPYTRGFASVWNSTIKPADLHRFGWNANPWVWVIEFERTEQTTPF